MSECCDTDPELIPGPKGAKGDAGEMGEAGIGLQDGLQVALINNYLEWQLDGQTFHHRLLTGPAPT